MDWERRVRGTSTALAAWLIVFTASCGAAPPAASAPSTTSYASTLGSTSPTPMAATSSPNVGVRFGPLIIASIGFAEAPAIDAPTGFRSIRVSLFDAQCHGDAN